MRKTPTSLNGLIVLVVEGDDLLRRYITAILLNSSCTVIVAENANDALALSVQHHGRIDLLLTEFGLEDLTGTELAWRFRLGRPHTRVLILADHGVSRPLEKYPTFLEKPFSPNDLRQKILALLSKPADGPRND